MRVISGKLKKKKILSISFLSDIKGADYFFIKKKLFNVIHYLNFNVARPIIAKIIEMIQNLITTVDSGQPFFSK